MPGSVKVEACALPNSYTESYVLLSFHRLVHIRKQTYFNIIPGADLETETALTPTLIFKQKNERL